MAMGKDWPNIDSLSEKGSALVPSLPFQPPIVTIDPDVR
jgi:hypothetical protein